MSVVVCPLDAVSCPIIGDQAAAEETHPGVVEAGGAAPAYSRAEAVEEGQCEPAGRISQHLE